MTDARADDSTSPTLLGQLRASPTDQHAWERFVDRYGRQIYRWCRAWGCQEADAEDVTQNVLVELARQMREFQYDEQGSFRGWLRTVVRRAWGRLLQRRQQPGTGAGGSGVLDVLANLPSDAGLVEALDNECNRELLELASQRVQLRVTPRTWQAFRMTALEEKSGADVARELNMQVGAVYMARSQVQKLLREEIEGLDRRD